MKKNLNYRIWIVQTVQQKWKMRIKKSRVSNDSKR